jgi:hypothetical protein
MAYTRDFEPLTIMLGSEDADTIDDKMRMFAQDVFERLVTLVQDINADPLVLKVLDDEQRVHWSAGAPQTTSTAWGVLLGGVAGGPVTVGATSSWYIAIPLSVAKKLSTLNARVQVTGTASGNLSLRAVNDAGAMVEIASVGISPDADVQTVTIVENVVATAGYSYYVRITLTTGPDAILDQAWLFDVGYVISGV